MTDRPPPIQYHQGRGRLVQDGDTEEASRADKADPCIYGGSGGSEASRADKADPRSHGGSGGLGGHGGSGDSGSHGG